MEVSMKNWMRYILTAFLIFMAVPATVTAAENASGSLTVEKNDVAVSLSLPEEKSQAVTSLRVKLFVSLRSGSMGEPDFAFDSAIKSMVKDASVSKEQDGYLVDLILSGKRDQEILDENGTVNLGTLSVQPKSKAYEIEVSFAGEEDNAGKPKVRYADAGSVSEEALSFTDTKSVVLKKEIVIPPPDTEAPPPDTEIPPTETQEPIKDPDRQPAPEEFTLTKPLFKAAVKNGDKAVRFTWTKVDGADGYVIYEYDSKTKQYKEIKTISDGGVVAFSKLFPYASTHKFKICAYKVAADGSRVYGEESAVVNATVAPDKVKGMAAKLKGTSKVTLSWKKVTKAKGYQIYRSNKKNGKYKLVKTIRKGGTKKCTLSYPAGKKYYYKIRAYLNGANGKNLYGSYSAAKTPKK